MNKTQKRERIYLYLARRDKRSIRLLSVLKEGVMPPTRIADPRTLGASEDLTVQLMDVFHANRMDWEPWAESAANYMELREQLNERGYQSPGYMKPLHPVESGCVRDVRNSRLA